MGTRKLTTKAVENAKPGKSRREVPDGLVPGLYLIVQPSGAKSWAIRYRNPAGKPRKHTLGRYPQMDLSAAREAGRAALAAADAGEDPAQAKKLKREAKADTFEAVVEAFVEKHAKRHNRSWQEQAAILRRHAVPAWRDRPIGQISRRDVLELVEGIHDRGAPYAANRTLATVRKLFAWSMERDMIGANPAAGVKAPGKEQSRDRVLEDEEIASLWWAFERMNSRAAGVFKLLLLTAQRRTEVATMRWADLDLDAATWTVPETKNDKPNVVPLSAPALEVIRAQPAVESSPYVFPGRGDPSKPLNGWGKPKDQASELAGVQDWRLHDLRRTAASGLARLGTPPHIVEAVLNHSSGTWAGVAGVYQRHRYDTEKRRALDAWAAHVMSVTGKTADSAEVVSIA